jgi:rRNA-processing protein EBP2
LSQLEQSKVAFQRPDDYYAEMVKTDAHMLKIKNSLMAERDKMAAVTQRKQQREAKAFMKQTRAKVIQDRQQSKKNDLDEIKRWKKGFDFC